MTERDGVDEAGVCDLVRESLSARLDHEVPLLAAGEVDAHLRGCPACTTHLDDLTALDRVATSAAGAEVPDGTDAILATLGERTERRPARRLTELRVLVGMAGAVQLMLALPLLLGLVGTESVGPGVTGPDVHIGRELGALQLALGVGFLVAALQPRRASGVLPVGVALGGAVLLVATIDVIGGRVSAVEELTHLGELIGVMGLWALARRMPATPHSSSTVVPA